MKKSIPVIAAAAFTTAALATASSLIAHADEHATITATEIGACGTVQVQITGTPLEVYRAITETPTRGEDVAPGDWRRQSRDRILWVDEIDGPAVTYRVIVPGETEDVYSEPVVVTPCADEEEDPTPTPTPTPSETPTPTPSPTPPAETPVTEPTPTDPPNQDPAPTQAPPPPVEKERNGGLAATGV